MTGGGRRALRPPCRQVAVTLAYPALCLTSADAAPVPGEPGVTGAAGAAGEMAGDDDGVGVGVGVVAVGGGVVGVVVLGVGVGAWLVCADAGAVDRAAAVRFGAHVGALLVLDVVFGVATVGRSPLGQCGTGAVAAGWVARCVPPACLDFGVGAPPVEPPIPVPPPVRLPTWFDAGFGPDEPVLIRFARQLGMAMTAANAMNTAPAVASAGRNHPSIRGHFGTADFAAAVTDVIAGSTDFIAGFIAGKTDRTSGMRDLMSAAMDLSQPRRKPGPSVPG